MVRDLVEGQRWRQQLGRYGARRARAGSSSCRPGRPPRTSTAPIASATTCSPIACSRSMPRRAGSIWHFQAVHHDIWDRDFPSPPTLVTVQPGRKNHRRRRADHQARLRLRPRPRDRRSALPGRMKSRSRRAPCRASVPRARSLCRACPQPFARQQLTADLLTRRTPAAQRMGRRRIREAAYRGTVHAVAGRPGHRCLSRLRRRRGVGWQRLRPVIRPSVRQRQRPGLDRRAGAR